jgi:hypothetical protein
LILIAISQMLAMRIGRNGFAFSSGFSAFLCGTRFLASGKGLDPAI